MKVLTFPCGLWGQICIGESTVPISPHCFGCAFTIWSLPFSLSPTPIFCSVIWSTGSLCEYESQPRLRIFQNFQEPSLGVGCSQRCWLTQGPHLWIGTSPGMWIDKWMVAQRPSGGCFISGSSLGVTVMMFDSGFYFGLFSSDIFFAVSEPWHPSVKWRLWLIEEGRGICSGALS